MSLKITQNIIENMSNLNIIIERKKVLKSILQINSLR